MVHEKRRFLVPTQIKSIWPEDPLVNTSEKETEALQGIEGDVASQISLTEIQGYLRNTLLRDSDWATMANHQELRVPYLGKRYMETVMGIAWQWKEATRKVNKPLLAHHISQANRQVLQRKKTGFELDYPLYLKGPLRDHLHTAMLHLNQTHGFRLDPDRIESELNTTGNKQIRRYWALVSLGLYLERHR